MTGFTSGTQALQGRTVNHDPEPYVGRLIRYPASIKPWADATGDQAYDPRPEFAVLDNPILAAFRAGMPQDDATYDISMDALDYLAALSDGTWMYASIQAETEIGALTYTDEQKTQAIRVLQRLGGRHG